MKKLYSRVWSMQYEDENGKIKNAGYVTFNVKVDELTAIRLLRKQNGCTFATGTPVTPTENR